MNATGVLVVDKPAGPTSHDIVGQARRLFATRAVGHAGTLDPMASGVMVLMLGEATKLSSYLTRHDKTYLAKVDFSRSTDTWDREGLTTLALTPRDSALSLEALTQALDAERHRTEQRPPPYSAIKVDGVVAHRAARRGTCLDLQPRPVTVQALELERWEPPWAWIRLTVSKGYYVRSLAHDLGQHLAIPAHLAELRRLASGPFTLDEAVAWPCEHPPVLLSLEQAAVRALPTAELTPEGERRARCGQALGPQDFRHPCPPGTSAWIGAAGHLVALGEHRESGPRVMRGFRAVP